MKSRSMICPLCGVENNDNWPVAANGVVKQGGCQDCWEKQSDEEWWKTVVRIDKMMNHCDSTMSLTGVHYPNRRGVND